MELPHDKRVGEKYPEKKNLKVNTKFGWKSPHEIQSLFVCFKEDQKNTCYPFEVL